MLYFQELLVSQRIKFFSAVLKLAPKNKDRDKEMRRKRQASTFAIMWMN